MYEWFYYFLFGDGTADLAVLTLAGATLAAGAIGGAAQVIGNGLNGLFGRSSQKSANATNLAIARENNAANLRLAREQNDWNLAQWNRENTYNLPVNQMTRFRQAGINPYMAMNQLTNGNSEAHLSSANLANQTPASVQPVDSPLQGLTDGVTGGLETFMSSLQQMQAIKESDSRIENYNADTYGKDIENKFSPEFYEGRNKAQKLYNLGFESDLKPKMRLNDWRASDEYMDIVKGVDRTNADIGQAVLNQYGAQLFMTMAQTSYYNTVAALNRGQLKWQDQVISQNIAESVQRVKSMAMDSETKRMEALTAQWRAKQEVRQGWCRLYLEEDKTKAYVNLSEEQAKLVYQQAWNQWLKNNSDTMDYNQKYAAYTVWSNEANNKQFMLTLTNEMRKKYRVSQLKDGMFFIDVPLTFVGDHIGTIASGVGAAASMGLIP